MKYIQKALELDPMAPSNFIHLGMLHSAVGDDNAAITAFKNAITLDHNNIEARLNLASLLNSQKNPWKAKEILLEVEPQKDLDKELVNNMLEILNHQIIELEEKKIIEEYDNKLNNNL